MNWNVVVAEIGPPLFRYFCMLTSREQADDLVQETLLRLVTKVERGDFDPAKGTIRAFAFGIGHRIHSEHRRQWRRDHRLRAVEPDSLTKRPAMPEAQPDHMTELASTRHQLLAAIRTLPSMEQSVLALLLDQDLSLGEIAEALELPLGTIKSHMHRAKAKLRVMLHGVET